jgi:toxin ParE1/3/4
MSSPEYTLVITDEANDDYQHILLYTLEQWGEKQQEVYDDLLDAALSRLKQDPRLGRKLPQLPPAYRAYHAGKHYLIYRVEGLEVVVFRILHERMNLSRHLP